MIPYDDLVAALTNWRARQGLPVSQLPTSGSGGVAAPLSSSGSSGAYASPGSGPARTAPPNAPPRGYSTNPPPLAEPDAAMHEDPLDVDDAALLEEASFDHEDDGMRYAGVQADSEATSIGAAPEPRDSFGGPTKPGRDNGDW